MNVEKEVCRQLMDTCTPFPQHIHTHSRTHSSPLHTLFLSLSHTNTHTHYCFHHQGWLSRQYVITKHWYQCSRVQHDLVETDWSFGRKYCLLSKVAVFLTCLFLATCLSYSSPLKIYSYIMAVSLLNYAASHPIIFQFVIYSTDTMGKELPRWSGYAAGRCTEYRGYQQLTARRVLETGAAWTVALLLIASSHFVKWSWKYSAAPMEFTKNTAKCVLNIEVGDVCGYLWRSCQ